MQLILGGAGEISSRPAPLPGGARGKSVHPRGKTRPGPTRPGQPGVPLRARLPRHREVVRGRFVLNQELTAQDGEQGRQLVEADLARVAFDLRNAAAIHAQKMAELGLGEAASAAKVTQGFLQGPWSDKRMFHGENFSSPGQTSP